MEHVLERIEMALGAMASAGPRNLRVYLEQPGPDVDKASEASVDAMIASVQRYSAYRSRWMTCVDTSAAFNPSFSQTLSSTSGDRCANAPTGPLIFPTATRSRAVSSRAGFGSTATTYAPVMRAYWIARWPRPPAP